MLRILRGGGKLLSATLIQYIVFDVKYLVTDNFLMKDFLRSFLYDSFHVGVSQIIKKLILHKILDIYLHTNYMEKGLSIF